LKISKTITSEETSMSKMCGCADFKRGIDWMDQIECLAWSQKVFCPTDIKPMQYCAWCGRALKDEDETKIMSCGKQM
jgi:hypothetical protein